VIRATVALTRICDVGLDRESSGFAGDTGTLSSEHFASDARSAIDSDLNWVLDEREDISVGLKV